MALLNYTTTISADKTIAEIQAYLVKKGASKISIDYENGQPIALLFMCKFRDEAALFSLPCRFKGIRKILNTESRATKTDEQSIKVGWRILKVWIEAQFAIVDTEMAELAEIFLPYAVTRNGDSVYQYLKSLDQNNSPLQLN